MRFLLNAYWNTDYDYTKHYPAAFVAKCVLTSGRHKGQEREYWFVEFSDLSSFVAFVSEQGSYYTTLEQADNTEYLRLNLEHECE